MIVALQDKIIIECEGDDGLLFLQKLLTQDVTLENPLLFALLLNPKGRIFCDLFIYKIDGRIFIECDDQIYERLMNTLSLYKLKSRVHFHVSENYVVCVSLSSAEYGLLKPAEEGFYADPRSELLGFRGIFLKNNLPSQVVYDKNAYTYHRLAYGIAEGLQEINSEKAFPLEYNFDLLHGICWTKGCYVGQELTARTKFVGEVRKRIFPYILVDHFILNEGEALIHKGQVVAEVIRALDDRGLIMLRFSEIVYEAGKPLILESASGGTCEVIFPYWLSAHVLPLMPHNV